MLPDSLLTRTTVARQTASWNRMLVDRSGPVVHVAADAEGGIIGFASGGPRRGTILPAEAEIYALYVLPDHQGQGIGRRLVARMFDYFSSREWNSAGLWVVEANQPARRFYEALGGRLGPRQVEQLGTGAVEEISYLWSL
jgi:GNAT superfamily N-acetyltransferase